MLKTNLLSLFVGVLIMTSCGNPPSIVSNSYDSTIVNLPYHIDLEKNLNNVRSVPISQIGEKLEYILLETSPKSLIKRIVQIAFSESYIFISDFNKLLQFDRSGKFIRQVGGNGKGPGEYIYVAGFCIDEKNEKIYIIAWSLRSVLVFDFDGKSIGSFKTPFNSSQFLSIDSNNFIFHSANVPIQKKDTTYSLYLTDRTGTSTGKIRNYLKRESKSGLMIGETPFYLYNDTVRFMEFGVDTLSTLRNKDLDPYAIFTLGKMKMDPDPSIPFQNPGRDEILDKLKQKLWIRTISENDHYIFLRLDLGLSDSSKFGIYDKKSLETNFLQNNGFKNDLDYGIDFWPKYIYNDKTLVDYIDAYKLLSMIHGKQSIDLKDRNTGLLNPFEKLEKELTETSNPVLIVLK